MPIESLITLFSTNAQHVQHCKLQIVRQLPCFPPKLFIFHYKHDEVTA